MNKRNFLVNASHSTLESRILLAAASPNLEAGSEVRNENGNQEDNVFDADDLSRRGVFNVIGRRGADTLDFPSTNPEDLLITATEGEITQRDGRVLPAVRLLDFSGSEVQVFNLSSVETIRTRGSFEINVQDALDTISDDGLVEVNLSDLIESTEEDSVAQEVVEQEVTEQEEADSLELESVRNENGNQEDNVFDADDLSRRGVFNVIGRRGADTLDFPSTNPEDLLITATEGEITQRNGRVLPAVRLLDFSGSEIQVFNLSSIETIRTRGLSEISVQDALDTISDNGLIEVNLSDLAS